MKLFMPIGLLYPAQHISLVHATDLDGIKQAVSGFSEYVKIFDNAANKGLN